MKKILIIRFSSIGDIVLTSPVIRCLRQKFPAAEIDFLTKDKYRFVVEYNQYLTNVITLSNDFSAVTRHLKQRQYDYIVDLHNNLRTLRVKKALGKVRSSSFEKLNIEKYLYTNLKINILPDVHIVDRYLATVESLGVVNDGKGLDYFVGESDRVGKDELPGVHQPGFIALVAGGTKATKRLPEAKLLELCQQLDYPIILLGDKEDAQVAEKIARQNPQLIYNACGKFNFNQSASVLAMAKLVITHDTGLMHVAAAFKKPVISVWGNTVPAFGMYPYFGSKDHPSSFIAEVKGLRCRPCSKIGYDKCPKKHFKCMKEIDITAITSVARQWVTNS